MGLNQNPGRLIRSRYLKKSVDKIAIVGGGSAGWLSAAYLAKHFQSTQPGAVQITLIESQDIGTTTNAWGVYQLGATTSNHFEGRVGIGTTVGDGLFSVASTCPLAR